MSLADWLAAGAEPAKMTMEEVRRQQSLLAVREEQATGQLERQLDDRDVIFRKGAETASMVLRRVLARRHARLDAEVRALERELARIGKELTGLVCIRRMLQSGVALKAPGDCTPLLTLLDDASADEEEFADLLARRLREDDGVEPTTGPVVLGKSDVLDVWSRMDSGEFESADEALKKLRE